VVTHIRQPRHTPSRDCCPSAHTLTAKTITRLLLHAGHVAGLLLRRLRVLLRREPVLVAGVVHGEDGQGEPVPRRTRVERWHTHTQHNTHTHCALAAVPAPVHYLGRLPKQHLNTISRKTIRRGRVAVDSGGARGGVACGESFVLSAPVWLRRGCRAGSLLRRRHTLLGRRAVEGLGRSVQHCQRPRAHLHRRGPPSPLSLNHNIQTTESRYASVCWCTALTLALRTEQALCSQSKLPQRWTTEGLKKVKPPHHSRAVSQPQRRLQRDERVRERIEPPHHSRQPQVR
jgi:hypothetical protein